MLPNRCNGTQDCDTFIPPELISEKALEEIVWNGLKMWHVIFLSMSLVLSIVILICCCIKIRIPRTKQEIEADYIRRKILRKFRKRLQAIQNQELDEMDLKKALDKIRAEFKSDSESLAQSDGGMSISSTGGGGGKTYRRASQIKIDISLEDLRAHSLGFGARARLAFSRLCGRSRSSKGDKIGLTVDVDGEAQITVPEGAFTTTTNKGKKQDPEAAKKGKEDKGKKQQEPAASTSKATKTVTLEDKGTKVKEKEKKKKEDPPKKVPVTKKKDDPPPPSTSTTPKVPPPKDPPAKDSKTDKKKEEKEKAKAEKTKLKIENEKAKKDAKKVEKEKVAKVKADKKEQTQSQPDKDNKKKDKEKDKKK